MRIIIITYSSPTEVQVIIMITSHQYQFQSYKFIYSHFCTVVSPFFFDITGGFQIVRAYFLVLKLVLRLISLFKTCRNIYTMYLNFSTKYLIQGLVSKMCRLKCFYSGEVGILNIKYYDNKFICLLNIGPLKRQTADIPERLPPLLQIVIVWQEEKGVCWVWILYLHFYEHSYGNAT